MLFIKNTVLAVLTSCTIVNGVRISIERFSDSTCQSQVSHDLINDNGCLVANGGGTSSSYKLNTNNEQGTDWEPCSGTGTLVLQTWQSSDSCSGSPDNSVGPISQESHEGSCGLTPIRSVKVLCI